MTIKVTHIHTCEVTCDGCGLTVQSLHLPEGWKMAYLGPEPGKSYELVGARDLCPQCAAVVEEALRSLERRLPGTPRVVELGLSE